MIYFYWVFGWFLVGFVFLLLVSVLDYYLEGRNITVENFEMAFRFSFFGPIIIFIIISVLLEYYRDVVVVRGKRK